MELQSSDHDGKEGEREQRGRVSRGWVGGGGG